MLREKQLEWGQWTSMLAEIDGLKIMALCYLISSCSTDLNGPPHHTKHHGQVPWLQVVFDYLSASASIDIHNHFHTGSTAMEDAWQTKNANLQKLAGVLGFCFTNEYLAYHYFWESSMKHSAFKIKLANVLMEFKEDSHCPQRLPLGSPAEEVEDKVHVLVLLEKPTNEKDGKERKFQRYQKYYFYCQHNPHKTPLKQKTHWHCEACVGSNGEVYPPCAPSTGQKCFQMHRVHGLPPKQCHTAQD